MYLEMKKLLKENQILNIQLDSLKGDNLELQANNA